MSSISNKLAINRSKSTLARIKVADPNNSLIIRAGVTASIILKHFNPIEAKIEMATIKFTNSNPSW
jgi:hypothetical protein